MAIEALLDPLTNTKTAVILTASEGTFVEHHVQVSTSKPSNVLLSKFQPGNMELEDILQTIHGLGIDIFYLEDQEEEYEISYVGDEYVFSNNRYIPSAHFGGLGESGFVISLDRFVLIGRNAINESFIGNRTKFGYYSVQRDRERFKDFAKRLYDVEEVYLMPGFSSESHIDLFIGGIPEANILSVSRNYYNRHSSVFHKIKERFHTDIIVSEDSKDEMSFENNYRVVYNKKGELFVITDNYATDLRAKLKDKGLNVVSTNNDISSLIDAGASIHCVTNVFHSIELLELFNQYAYAESLRIRQYRN